MGKHFNSYTQASCIFSLHPLPSHRIPIPTIFRQFFLQHIFPTYPSSVTTTKVPGASTSLSTLLPITFPTHKSYHVAFA